MGPDYTSYLSDAGEGQVGVVLAHGFGVGGPSAAAWPVAGEYPTSVAFGMSMTQSRHVQQAVNDPPPRSGNHRRRRRQLVGQQRPAGAMAVHVRADGDPGYCARRVETKAKVTRTPALEDHPRSSA